MYVLLTTGHFDRRVVKFTQAHPELKKPLAKDLKNLEPIRLYPPCDSIRSAENLKGSTRSASRMSIASP